MPIYEYQCSACEHALEAFQSMSEDKLKDCPKCGKATLDRLISAAGFQLKGTGWYATDFKNSGKPKTQPKTEKTTKENNPTTDKKAAASKPAKTDTKKTGTTGD